MNAPTHLRLNQRLPIFKFCLSPRSMLPLQPRILYLAHMPLLLPPNLSLKPLHPQLKLSHFLIEVCTSRSIEIVLSYRGTGVGHCVYRTRGAGVVFCLCMGCLSFLSGPGICSDLLRRPDNCGAGGGCGSCSLDAVWGIGFHFFRVFLRGFGAGMLS